MVVKKNTTGCEILDKAGITSGSRYGGQKICRRCKEKECILVTKDRLKAKKVKKSPTRTEERWVQCSHCGATETLTLRNGILVKTQKWQQRGERIFHQIDCGEVK